MYLNGTTWHDEHLHPDIPLPADIVAGKEDDGLQPAHCTILFFTYEGLDIKIRFVELIAEFCTGKSEKFIPYNPTLHDKQSWLLKISDVLTESLEIYRQVAEDNNIFDTNCIDVDINGFNHIL